MRSFNLTFPNGVYLKLGLLFLVSAAVTLPIFFYGIPSGNDLPQHYQFALTFNENIQNGIFYPSWSAASNAGFGDVGIRFYPPFSYYVLIVFRLLAGNWYEASVLVFCFWFFIGGTGAYLWAREWFGKQASLCAAVIYILMPYHVNQIYNAFTYAEFAASAILPFCFLFTTRICRKGNFKDVVGLSVFFALLVLTHLPMTVIGSMALLVYALASLEKSRLVSTLAKLFCSVFIGLSASAFYWVRMISELNFVKHSTEEFTSQFYDFHINFLVAFLYVPVSSYNDRSLWFADLMLLITLALILPGALIFYCKTKGTSKPKLYNAAFLLIFAVFISTPLSLFIWDNFKILQKVQFPWRWLAIISLCGVIFTAAGFEYLGECFRTKMRPLALIMVGLIIAGVVFSATQVIKPAVYIPRREFIEKVKKLPDAPSYDCWLAVWSVKTALANTERVSTKDRKVDNIVWNPTTRVFRVAEGEAQTARIATFYYPHWQATINGEEVTIEKDTDGVILIPLPPQQAEVRLFFREPFFVRAANILSAAGWLFLAVFGAIRLLTKYRRRKLLKQHLPVI